MREDRKSAVRNKDQGLRIKEREKKKWVERAGGWRDRR
jgi:hypothetical protein